MVLPVFRRGQSRRGAAATACRESGPRAAGDDSAYLWDQDNFPVCPQFARHRGFVRNTRD